MLVNLTDEAQGLGVNWGGMASHPLDPNNVVKMLKDNGIKKVKLFDAEPSTMKALSGSGISVIVGIPNDKLASISSDYKHAQEWVKENITKYDHNGGVDIRFGFVSANLLFFIATILVKPSICISILFNF